ncbi:MAG: hypothetical protein QOK42_2030 [Frankiaceae bacterium]|nr:hypothetical protein [Frankiaceae bacterium]
MQATGSVGTPRPRRCLDGRALLSVAAGLLSFAIAAESRLLGLAALGLVVLVTARYWRHLEPWLPAKRSWLDSQALERAAADRAAQLGTITRQRDAVEALVQARRGLEAGADRQATVLRAARAAAAAAVALYVESQDGVLVALAADGASPMPLALGLGSLCRRALDTQQTQVATGADGPTKAESDAVAAFSAAADRQLNSVVCLPVALGEGSPGVLVLGLSRALLALPGELVAVLGLLVGETSRIPATKASLLHPSPPERRDDLTGALTRWAGELALHLEVDRSVRNGVPLGLALVELDRFQDFTATRGGSRADQLLASAVGAWNTQLRNDDVLIRWDSRTFMLLLPGCEQADAERAGRQLRAHVPMGQTASVGFTIFTGAEDVEQAIDRADQALQRAKRLGRNRSLAMYAPRIVPAPRASAESLQQVG